MEERWSRKRVKEGGEEMTAETAIESKQEQREAKIEITERRVRSSGRDEETLKLAITSLNSPTMFISKNKTFGIKFPTHTDEPILAFRQPISVECDIGLFT